MLSLVVDVGDGSSHFHILFARSPEENPAVEESVPDPVVVQLRVLQQVLLVDVRVEDPQQHDRKARVENVVHLDPPLEVEFLPAEASVEGEPELSYRHDDVLVEHVADELRQGQLW